METRLKKLEEKQGELHHLLYGNLEETGVVPLLKSLAETVYGPDGKGGIKQEVGDLRELATKGKGWIAGAVAVGTVSAAVVTWVLEKFVVQHIK